MDAALFDHLCTLGKINVDESEKETLSQQMSRIIDLMDSIKSVNSHELPPAEGVGFENLRKDEAAPSLTREAALKNATDPRDGCFTVPKIME